MKIEVNVEKRYVFGLLLVGLAILGVAGVIAYSSSGTGGNPAVFGHSIDEMDWSKTIPGNLSVNGICIGTDCRTSWPASSTGVAGVSKIIAGSGISISPLGGTGDIMINATSVVGGSSQWTTSGDNINYNAGNVSTTKYVKTAGVCIGSNCMTTVRAKVIYEVNSVCGGGLSLSSTCSSSSCTYSIGIRKYDGYYQCSGTCSTSQKTCDNTLIGYLVK